MNRKAFHPAIIAAAQEIVDGVIEMKIEEEQSGLVRYLRVLKMKGCRHTTSWVPIEVDDFRGVLPAKKTETEVSQLKQS
jgi:KaiC/GvpD/RAD55 family RecA-like ATPase